MQPRTNSKAVVSLISGIASIVMCPLIGVVGLWTGLVARREIRQSEGRESGDGLAVGGIATSVIGLLVIGLVVVLILAVTLLGRNASVKFSFVGSTVS